MTLPSPRVWRALTLLSLTTLIGCASMSIEECLHANWYQRGVLDGESGEKRTYVEEHAKACKEAHVVPDFARWTAGWERGIVNFCTPENGFEVGRRGSYYQRSCPPQYDADFMAGYRDGKAIYDAERKVDDLENRIRNQEKKLRDSKDDRERGRLRDEIRSLDRELRQARDDLYRAERRARRY